MKTFAIFGLFLCLVSLLFADSFELRDGEIVEGRLVGVSEAGELEVFTARGLRRLSQKEIKSIRRDAARPATRTGAAPAAPFFRAQNLVPGLPQYRAGRRTAGVLYFAGFCVSAAGAAYYYRAIQENARAAQRSPAYHLYLDGSFQKRHAAYRQAYFASLAFGAGLYGAHGIDLVLSGAEGPSAGTPFDFGLVLFVPVDW